MRKLSHAYICGIWLMLLIVSLCTAQEKIRTLDESNRRYTHPNTPISIISRELGGRPFNDKEVLAGPDWLKDLTLTVKNVSSKTIIWFEISLIIPKQGNMPDNSGMDYEFPPAPEPVLDADGKPTGGYYPLRVLKPGEIVKIKVNEGQLGTLDLLKEWEAGEINRVFIDIRYVRYEDGTGWSLGLDTQDNPDCRLCPGHAGTPETSYRERFSPTENQNSILNYLCVSTHRQRLGNLVKSIVSLSPLNEN